MKFALALAITATIGVACGGGAPVYAVRFAEAERAETAGRYGEAAKGFDDAAKATEGKRARDHALYLAALMYLRAGDVTTGAARLAAIAAMEPRGEHSAQAAYKLAEIHLANGDPGAWTEIESVARRFPESGVGRVALHKVARHMDETGPQATLAWLETMRAAMDSSELGESIAYEIAVRVLALGRAAEAHDLMLAIAERWPYPSGAHFDDSLYRASEIDEQLGKYEEAISHLDRMLLERESAHVVGSYDRPRFPDAAWRIAVLARDRLHDDKRAREAFRRFFDEFPLSPMRDDAAWQEAALLRAEGDASGACDRLAALVDACPDSRFVPCAEQTCTGVKRGATSRAPKACHAYLTR